MGGANTTPRNFEASQVPDLRGRVFLITGASTGLGLQTAKVLLQKNATVVITSRSAQKGKDSVDALASSVPEGAAVAERVRHLVLSLDDFKSIRAAAEGFKALDLPLHVLVNNAGVMMCPKLTTTDGLEYQFGVNHVGHFLLTKLLFPTLAANSTTATPSRVVTLTSSFHEKGPREGILFDDINWTTTPYDSGLAYGHSKFANLVFSNELNKRAQARGAGEPAAAAVVCNAVHPGFVDTDLTRHKAAEFGIFGNAVLAIYKRARGALPVTDGALTQLYAATSPSATAGGKFFIPIAAESEPFPGCPPITQELSDRLWTLSEQLVGETFDVV